MLSKFDESRPDGVLKSFRSHLLPLLLLLVTSLLVYGRMIGHDFQVSWDDEIYVMDNPMVHGLSPEHVRNAFKGPFFCNYAPFHLISYMLDFELWQLWPGGYLLTNLLLHIANGLLVYRTFLQLHCQRLVAVIGAAVFLLHPLQVESVAWVSQRKNLLAMLFFLLAWEAYRRYRAASGSRRAWNYVFSVILYAGAILSKSVTVIFPVIVLLYDLCFPAVTGAGQGGRLRSETPDGGLNVPVTKNLARGTDPDGGILRSQLWWLDKIPYILAAAGGALMVMQAQTPVGDNWNGTEGGRVPFHGGSPLATFYSMLPVFCRYLGQLAWPARLSAQYNPALHTAPDAIVIAAGGLLCLVGWLCYRLYRYDRKLGFWALVFWIGFLPVSQIVPLVTMMNDRYVYFPMLGFASLAGAACRQALDRLRPGSSAFVYAVVAVWLVGLSAVAYQRVGVWRNSVSLWSDAVSKVPGRALTWVNLAQAYERTGNGMIPEAIEAYSRSIALDPSNAYALYGLGRVYAHIGNYDKAYSYITALLRLSPDHVMGVNLLGTVHEALGDFEKAERAYRRAAELQPEAVEVAMQLANLSVMRGDLITGRDRFMDIENRLGKFPVVAYMLAWIDIREGHTERALDWLEAALDRGYAEYRSIRDLDELVELHGHPRFEALLRRYGAKPGSGGR